jgi:MerR family transcriptional regulator, copper efflux regulator
MTADALTINEAAEITGWSPRMLRYIERVGLVVPPRSASGYRLYGAGELQRLRTLRELLDGHRLNLGEVGFARRMREDHAMADAVSRWLEARPERPDHVPAEDWLRLEQDTHARRLAAATSTTT